MKMNIKNVVAAVSSLTCLGAGIVMCFRDDGVALPLFIAAWWIFNYIDEE